MAKNVKVGDHVTWNSEAGHVGSEVVAPRAQLNVHACPDLPRPAGSAARSQGIR